jgi:hypothetical protein
MKRVNYELPNYPALDFSTFIDVVDRQRAVFDVFIQARGPAAHRRSWVKEFETWCAGHGYVPTGGKAYKQTLERSVTLVGYPAIAAFIVEWVGLDWVDRALQKPETQPQDPAPYIQALQDEVRAISKTLEVIEEKATLADYRLWAAARGILGMSLPPVNLAKFNWDMLFKPKEERQG